jgi:hypothetical protein
MFPSSGEEVGDTNLLGPLESINLKSRVNPCQYNYSYINTSDQDMSMGDNRKM